MFRGGLGGVWKVSGRCLGGVWDVLEMFGWCLGVFGCCLVCVWVVLVRLGVVRGPGVGGSVPGQQIWVVRFGLARLGRLDPPV